jgi:hypothetical protein
MAVVQSLAAQMNYRESRGNVQVAGWRAMLDGSASRSTFEAPMAHPVTPTRFLYREPGFAILDESLPQ